jgi:hypothetical protein
VTVRQLLALALMLACTLVLSGCKLAEGIFKAGVWSGVIIVVLVVVGVFALFSRLR